MGSYTINEFGLYDMGGNLYEWCGDWYDPDNRKTRLMRGAGWLASGDSYMLSAERTGKSWARNTYIGFRVVLGTVDERRAQDSELGGYIGIYHADIVPEMAKALKVRENQKGTVIRAVSKGLPADLAGVKAGDLIVQLNGAGVDGRESFTLQINNCAPGELAQTEIIRAGRRMELSVRVGHRATIFLERAGQDAPPPSDERLKGVAIAELPEANRKRLRVPEGTKGALAVDVPRRSAAYNAGLRNNDLILWLNQWRVWDAATADKARRSLNSDIVWVHALRRGKNVYFLVDESQ